MKIFLLVLFGAAGTLARYALQGLVQFWTGPVFPSGTLVVNLLGCFFLGFSAQYALHHLTISPEWRTALTIGFFGAFTTFSTFGWETVQMLESGEWTHAGLYIALTVLGGFLLVMAGMRIADWL